MFVLTRNTMGINDSPLHLLKIYNYVVLLRHYYFSTYFNITANMNVPTCIQVHMLVGKLPMVKVQGPFWRRFTVKARSHQ